MSSSASQADEVLIHPKEDILAEKPNIWKGLAAAKSLQDSEMTASGEIRDVKVIGIRPAWVMQTTSSSLLSLISCNYC